jgi:hypothetical protein
MTNLLCRVGLHSWEIIGALARGGPVLERCRRCPRERIV